MTSNATPNDIEVWVSNPKVVVTTEVGGFDGTDEVETQSKVIGKAFDVIKADSAEFVESWKKAFHAVEALFAADSGAKEQGTFGLESVTAKLSLSASGKVAFVGELGGEIAFEAVFKRWHRGSGTVAASSPETE